MKNLILDCGGVLVWPRLGEWNLPYGMAAILGERAQDIHTARYLMAHRKAAEWLDESRIIKDVEEERGLRREYVKAMDVYMDWHMTADEIRRLTDDFTDNILRYGFFEDAKEYLLPNIRGCVLKISPEEGLITVHMMDGLEDL